MSIRYVIDTHAFLWFLSGSSQLSSKAKAVLDAPKSKLFLPAIVLAESVWIVRRSKKSTLSVESVLRSVSEDPRLEVYPLDLAVIARTVGLTAIKEMHDRQIVATALVLQSQGEKVSLLTCDRNITDSNLVPTIW